MIQLNDSVRTSETQIENYDLIRSDRNRHGGGVACFIRNDLSSTRNHFFPLRQKIYSWRFLYHIPSLLLWVLFIFHQANVVSRKQLLNIFQRITQTIQKYIF